MNTPLDQALAAASAAEATYESDVASVATIQAAIASATSPLAPAEAQLNTDAVAFNAALDAVSTAAQAAKVPVAPAAASPAKSS